MTDEQMKSLARDTTAKTEDRHRDAEADILAAFKRVRLETIEAVHEQIMRREDTGASLGMLLAWIRALEGK